MLARWIHCLITFKRLFYPFIRTLYLRAYDSLECYERKSKIVPFSHLPSFSIPIFVSLSESRILWNQSFYTTKTRHQREKNKYTFKFFLFNVKSKRWLLKVSLLVSKFRIKTRLFLQYVFHIIFVIFHDICQ